MDLNRPTTIDKIPDRHEDLVILSLDDESLSQSRLKLLFDRPFDDELPIEFLTTQSVTSAKEIIASQKIHVLLLDVDLGRLPDGTLQNGIEAIPDFLQLNCSRQILMITGSPDLQNCAEAMRLGAFGYVTKDMNDDVIRAQIRKAAHVAQLETMQLRSSKMNRSGSVDLAGDSAAMKAVRSRLIAMAESSRPILIIGETGTGKSHSARLLHEHRKQFLKQKDRPFFAVNVAELGKDRIENELFGHEKGSYTGADQMRQGYLELADGGTLFLDEIGELPLELQAKLLKVLDEKKFRRIGSPTERSSNFHLICATNRPLEEMVERGEFREDLWMRISTLLVQLPTLKERKEDIPQLIRALLPKACTDNSVFVSFDDLPQDFIDYLYDVPFKGNVRGLEQQLSRLLLFSPRDKNGLPLLTRWREVPGLALKRFSASSNHTPRTLSEFVGQNLDFNSPDFSGYQEFMSEMSEKIFRSAFARFQGVNEVARALKLSKATVSYHKRSLRLVTAASKPIVNTEGKPK